MNNRLSGSTSFTIIEATLGLVFFGMEINGDVDVRIQRFRAVICIAAASHDRFSDESLGSIRNIREYPT